MAFKRYRIIGAVAHVGADVRLAIADEQLRRRAHNVEVVDKAAGGAVVRSKVPLQFKVGEIVGFEELPANLVTGVEPLDPASSKADEKAAKAASGNKEAVKQARAATGRMQRAATERQASRKKAS